ncbi:hypothetical protein CR513_31722, partial [Mucuna pruriens]
MELSIDERLSDGLPRPNVDEKRTWITQVSVVGETFESFANELMEEVTGRNKCAIADALMALFLVLVNKCMIYDEYRITRTAHYKSVGPVKEKQSVDKSLNPMHSPITPSILNF